MSDKQSILFEAYRDASQRFDYFMISLAGALFAYVGQNWRPTPLTFSSGTFELAAIILFASSVAAGLKHRQYVVALLKLNHGILEAEGQHAQLLPGSLGQGIVQLATGEVLSPGQAKDLLEIMSKCMPQLRKTFGNIDSYASVAYIIRNWALVLGFLALASSKVLAAYALEPF
jgi:hypothetical protein